MHFKNYKKKQKSVILTPLTSIPRIWKEIYASTSYNRIDHANHHSLGIDFGLLHQKYYVSISVLHPENILRTNEQS